MESDGERPIAVAEDGDHAAVQLHRSGRWRSSQHQAMAERPRHVYCARCMVSATPSGGWLQSNPVVPGLGASLNTRAQMFWLDEGLPTTLAPGRRPRTTLSPSMARRPDGTRVAFGTPGGDSQDQWQLFLFLRLAHYGMNLQEAIDAPLVLSAHLQSSFYPRGAGTGQLLVEQGFPPEAIEDLRRKGHLVEVAEPWTLGRLTAAERGSDGILHAAATPRLMQAYAVGR